MKIENKFKLIKILKVSPNELRALNALNISDDILDKLKPEDTSHLSHILKKIMNDTSRKEFERTVACSFYSRMLDLYTITDPDGLTITAKINKELQYIENCHLAAEMMKSAESHRVYKVDKFINSMMDFIFLSYPPIIDTFNAVEFEKACNRLAFRDKFFDKTFLTETDKTVWEECVKISKAFFKGIHFKYTSNQVRIIIVDYLSYAKKKGIQDASIDLILKFLKQNSYPNDSALARLVYYKMLKSVRYPHIQLK